MAYDFTKDVRAPREALSPEGVEERIEKEVILQVTLTAGGRFRVYIEDEINGRRPCGLYDTIEEATLSMGHGMVFYGGMMIAPEKTLETVARNLGRKTPR